MTNTNATALRRFRGIFAEFDTLAAILGTPFGVGTEGINPKFHLANVLQGVLNELGANPMVPQCSRVGCGDNGSTVIVVFTSAKISPRGNIRSIVWELMPVVPVAELPRVISHEVKKKIAENHEKTLLVADLAAEATLAQARLIYGIPDLVKFGDGFASAKVVPSLKEHQVSLKEGAIVGPNARINGHAVLHGTNMSGGEILGKDNYLLGVRVLGGTFNGDVEISGGVVDSGFFTPGMRGGEGTIQVVSLPGETLLTFCGMHVSVCQVGCADTFGVFELCRLCAEATTRKEQLFGFWPEVLLSHAEAYLMSFDRRGEPYERM